MAVRDLQNGSLLKGTLPKGCRYCEMGAKLVLLVTGRCSKRCFYCPLASEKWGSDQVYADELRVGENEDILLEAKLIDALGAGITGGDPLEIPERTCDYIVLLKDEFGEAFHIHLYTSVTATSAIRNVEEAGLDEIRFHPPVSAWENIEETDYARAFRTVTSGRMDLGVEIPVLPGKEKETRELLRSLDGLDVQFLNLDELEFSETNWMKLREKGYDTKDDVSSAVAGCDDLARSLMDEESDMSIHYCSSSFKDGVQLKNRILRRAHNIAGDWEMITPEGTLYKGVIENGDLEELRDSIRTQFDVPDEFLNVDYEKSRLEMAPWVLKEIADKIDHPCFLVEEYPTADRLEVEREPLNNK